MFPFCTLNALLGLQKHGINFSGLHINATLIKIMSTKAKKMSEVDEKVVKRLSIYFVSKTLFKAEKSITERSVR